MIYNIFINSYLIWIFIANPFFAFLRLFQALKKYKDKDLGNIFLFTLKVPFLLITRRIAFYILVGDGMRPDFKNEEIVLTKKLKKEELKFLKEGDIITYNTAGEGGAWNLLLPIYLKKVSALNLGDDSMEPNILKGDTVYFKFINKKKPIIPKLNQIVIYRQDLKICIGRIKEIYDKEVKIISDNSKYWDDQTDVMVANKDIFGRVIEVKTFVKSNQENNKIIFNKIKKISGNRLLVEGINKESLATVCLVPWYKKNVTPENFKRSSHGNIKNRSEISRNLITGKLLLKWKYSNLESKKLSRFDSIISYLITLILACFYYLLKN